MPDFESDFSVFHRVDDIYEMNSADFFKKAYRIPAYQGVMKMRAEAERNQGHSPAPSSSSPNGDDVREMSAAGMAVAHPELFEMSTA